MYYFESKKSEQNDDISGTFDQKLDIESTKLDIKNAKLDIRNKLLAFQIQFRKKQLIMQ